MTALAALLTHLELYPAHPLPDPLRRELLLELRATKAERDRLLRDLAAHLDPGAELGRWGRARLLEWHVRRWCRPENRGRSGKRPLTEVERLLQEVERCGCGLPESARRLWDALTP